MNNAIEVLLPWLAGAGPPFVYGLLLTICRPRWPTNRILAVTVLLCIAHLLFGIVAAGAYAALQAEPFDLAFREAMYFSFRVPVLQLIWLPLLALPLVVLLTASLVPRGPARVSPRRAAGPVSVPTSEAASMGPPIARAQHAAPAASGLASRAGGMEGGAGRAGLEWTEGAEWADERRAVGHHAATRPEAAGEAVAETRGAVEDVASRGSIGSPASITTRRSISDSIVSPRPAASMAPITPEAEDTAADASDPVTGIRVSFDRIHDQLPSGALAWPPEAVANGLQEPGHLVIPHRLITPQLPEAVVRVPWHVVATQFPARALALSHADIATRLPAGGLLLPLDEIVRQLPPETFELALPEVDTHGIESFPAPFKPKGEDAIAAAPIQQPVSREVTLETPAIEESVAGEREAIAPAAVASEKAADISEREETAEAAEASEVAARAAAEEAVEREVVETAGAAAAPPLAEATDAEELSAPAHVASEEQVAEARRLAATLDPLKSFEVGAREIDGIPVVALSACELDADAMWARTGRLLRVLRARGTLPRIEQVTLRQSEGALVVTALDDKGPVLASAVRQRGGVALLELLSRKAAGQYRAARDEATARDEAAVAEDGVGSLLTAATQDTGSDDTSAPGAPTSSAQESARDAASMSAQESIRAADAESGRGEAPEVDDAGNPQADASTLTRMPIGANLRRVSATLTALGPLEPAVFRYTDVGHDVYLFIPAGVEAESVARRVRELCEAAPESDLRSIVARLGGQTLFVRPLSPDAKRPAVLAALGGTRRGLGLARRQIEHAAAVLEAA